MFLTMLIIGAVTAVSVGTTAANQAMDGALFAPEIKDHQKRIREELDLNDELVEEIFQMDDDFKRQVDRINAMLEVSNLVSTQFFVAQAGAAELASSAMVEDLNLTSLNPVELDELGSVIVGSFATTTSVLSIPSVQRALARNGGRLAFGLKALNVAAKSAALRAGGATKIRAVSKAFSIVAASKAGQAATPVVKASARLLGSIGKLGLRASISSVARFAGPLSVVFDAAFLITDIVASKKKARALKKERDRIIAANAELLDVRQDMRYAQQDLDLDLRIMEAELLKLVKFVGPIVVFHMFDSAEELPVGMQSLEQFDAKETLTLDELLALKVFLDEHGIEFTQRLFRFYVDKVATFKSYVDACDMAPEALVREHTFLGLFGLDFVKFLNEAEFSTAFMDIVPVECPRDFDRDQVVNGWSAKAAMLTSGKIREIDDKYWVYTPVDGTHHPYLETHRDQWSVYMKSVQDGSQRLQLDLWRNELISSSNTQARSVVDTVTTAFVFRRSEFEAVSDVPFEVNADRPGNGYRKIDTDSPNLCADACGRDPVCKSFSWIQERGRCYLKDAAPEAVFYRGARSGIKALD